MRVSWISTARAAALLGAAATTALSAQSPTLRTLGKPTAATPQQFALVNTVRELSTGAVYVADPLSGDLWLLDPTLKSGKQLGREGSGPGEFRQPDAVWAVRGDTTLLTDLGNARLSVLDAKGTFLRSISMMLGDFSPTAGPPPIMTPAGTDERGRIYFQSMASGPMGARDSLRLLRYDPATKKVDTLASLKGPTLDRQESGSENQRTVRIRPMPLATGDGWAVNRAGVVAIVRVDPYRVDLIDASGKRTTGATVAYPRVKIGSAEKDEWAADQQLRGGIGISMENINGQVSMSMTRNKGSKPTLDGLRFPEFKPPFEVGTVVVDPQGRTWVRRHLEAKQPIRYDVFDATGKLVSGVNMPNGRRLVGFGKGALYAAALDGDGLATLERYAMPTL